VAREVDAWSSSGLSPVSGFPYVNIDQSEGTGVRIGYRLLGVSLTTGQILYNNTYADEPFSADQLPYSTACHVGNNGKLAILMRKGYYNIHDALTGKLLYQTETMDYPWDEPGFGAYTQASAYGLIYRLGYGAVYAFDWETGEIVWKYSAPAFSAYETPYVNENGTTVYSWNGANLVADGKIYMQNTEHTPTQPITRGWGLHCLNATTGELLWKIKGCMRPSAVADGYLAASDSYDGYLYVFGKGKSETTLSAPLTAITQGESLVLTGSVLDQSPAQPGTPCVSADSMTTQMEYLHKQQPIAGLWGNETITGVPVSLDTVDPNGNCRHIADVTTDGYSGTFGYTWTPDVPGQYTVTATFMGDDSYGSSFAQTYISVVEAPAATATPEPQQAPPDSIPYVIGIGVAILIAIAIVGILLLRKRP